MYNMPHHRDPTESIFVSEPLAVEQVTLFLHWNQWCHPFCSAHTSSQKYCLCSTYPLYNDFLYWATEWRWRAYCYSLLIMLYHFACNKCDVPDIFLGKVRYYWHICYIFLHVFLVIDLAVNKKFRKWRATRKKKLFCMLHLSF